MATTNVYVLKLADGKYYVGKSEDPQQRFQQHRGGTGSSWTQKYKPIAMEKVISNCSPLDEDKITKEYMMKYGMDNVRGGTYVSVDLDDFQKEALNREIWAAKDCCTQCGRKGHFIKDCLAKTDVSGNEIVYEDDESEEEDYLSYCMKSGIQVLSTLNSAIASNRRNTCYRCGRPGHYADECYARTTVAPVRQSAPQSCYRCGRPGHYADECYASRSAHGKRLY